jgi:hypothetical protein
MAEDWGNARRWVGRRRCDGFFEIQLYDDDGDGRQHIDCQVPGYIVVWPVKLDYNRYDDRYGLRSAAGLNYLSRYIFR